MQAIKNFMLDMLVMMMPVFSPSLIFAMISFAVAGLMILFVGKESPVKIGIRFAGWAILTTVILLFIVDPIISMIKSNAENHSIKSAFTQLANFPSFGNGGVFKFILQLMPYVLLLVTIFILVTKTAASALGMGRFLLIMGIIYIMCQIAGIFLGLSASVNFGDFMNWQNLIVEFWKLGVGMIIVGSALSISGRIARDRAILKG